MEAKDDKPDPRERSEKCRKEQPHSEKLERVAGYYRVEQGGCKGDHSDVERGKSETEQNA